MIQFTESNDGFVMTVSIIKMTAKGKYTAAYPTLSSKKTPELVK